MGLSIPASIQPEDHFRVVAGRYELRQLFGRGGMALVFEAYDRERNERVALKRLVRSPDEVKHARHLDLFEREYHTLAELAHPRVVEVLDFGRDGDRAFYTMELLEGGDLHQRAPLPWQQACAVARNICSALSFLHARRLLHRDLSPRNVRCSANGIAKLIDFGAVSPFGPNKLLVGTPPCCAPESVNLQALDARTDLYALGASLYFALTGRHAYPARSVQQLPDAWSAGFASPAQLVPDIPPALDHLVRDLLRLDPDARPASAWEVVQRLSAIDAVPFDSSLPMAQAYLATPTLLGREEPLNRIARRMKRVAAGSGSSVLLTGAPGIGRSRLLDSALLRATLLGLTTLHANADDTSLEYAVVHLLVLADLGRYREAAERGERYLEQAQRQLGFEPAQLALASALVRAHARLPDASSRAHAVLTSLQRDGATALHLGFAHEVCARIALTRDDTAAFERHFAECRALYCAHRHPALVAKLERLRQQLLPGVGGADALRPAPVDAGTVSRIVSELGRCSDSTEHAQRALSWLARHAGSEDAFLFEIVDGELQCAAQLGETQLDAELTRIAHAFLEQQLTVAETTVGDELPPHSDSRAELTAPNYIPLALIHNEGAQTLFTGLVLFRSAHSQTRAQLASLGTEISRQRAHRGCQQIRLNN